MNNKTIIYYYTTTSGDNPFDKFLDSLTEKQQRKIGRVLSYIEEYGLITAVPHVKKLTGTPLWEIRILGQDNIKVFYASTLKDTIVVLHGFAKKSQKTPLKELEIALARLQDWQSSLAIDN